jgi:hypothetical protein
VPPEGAGVGRSSPAAAAAGEGEPKPAAARAGIEVGIPGMAAKELANLHANALRLLSAGASRMQAEAERLLPLIEAELQKRKAEAPSERVRKPAAVRKAPVKRKAAAKSAKAG